MDDPSPQYHNDSIEDVEAVLDVTKWAFCDDLEQHFSGKEQTEHEVAVLQNQRQVVGLQQAVNTHKSETGREKG